MPMDREKLKEVVEKIQVGDSEEGAEAIAEVMDVVRNESRAAVEQDFAYRRLKAENDAAVKAFGDKYPELKGESRRNNLLRDAAGTALREELLNDLRGAGLDEEVLKPIQNDVGQLVAAHGYCRLHGKKLREPTEVLGSVGETLVEEFNIQRAGGVRPHGESHREAVASLKAARGFTARDADAAGRHGGSRAPGAGKLTPEQSDKAASYVEQLRAARGFPSRASR